MQCASSLFPCAYVGPLLREEPPVLALAAYVYPLGGGSPRLLLQRRAAGAREELVLPTSPVAPSYLLPTIGNGPRIAFDGTARDVLRKAGYREPLPCERKLWGVKLHHEGTPLFDPTHQVLVSSLCVGSHVASMPGLEDASSVWAPLGALVAGTMRNTKVPVLFQKDAPSPFRIKGLALAEGDAPRNFVVRPETLFAIERLAYALAQPEVTFFKVRRRHLAEGVRLLGVMDDARLRYVSGPHPSRQAWREYSVSTFRGPRQRVAVK